MAKKVDSRVRHSPQALCSPLGVVVFSPEFVVWLVHEHVVGEEHDIDDPPHAEDEGEEEEEFPVGPGQHRDEDRDHEQVEECSLRWGAPHFFD